MNCDVDTPVGRKQAASAHLEQLITGWQSQQAVLPKEIPILQRVYLQHRRQLLQTSAAHAVPPRFTQAQTAHHPAVENNIQGTACLQEPY